MRMNRKETYGCEDIEEYETQVHTFDSGIDAANTFRLAYSAMRFASQCVGLVLM